MALTTKKNVTITGVSTIEGQQVAYFNATIPQDEGTSSINRTVTNQTLYEANKTEVRADERAFQDKVYEVEDSLAAE